LKHCTALVKRLQRLQQIHNNFSNQIIEQGGSEHFTQVPNFSVGLGHVLSGIMAHLSSTVISATMAWHLMTNDSRFKFSHEFSPILLSQFESWLRDEDINFRFQRCRKNGNWMD
jgi:hypothetical protein